MVSMAFFVIPSLFANANNEEEQQELPCETCAKDDAGNILEVVVDENVTVDFNTDTPTCAGDADLCAFFSYEKPDPTDVRTWNAIFNLGDKKLVIKPHVTVTVATVPLQTNTRESPGMKISTDCEVLVENDATISLTPHNTRGGDLFIKAGGPITINGTISNIGSGTLGMPGKILLTSCCGNIITGSVSHIVSQGTDPGGDDIYILAKETITINGLVEAVYKRGHPANVHIFSTRGGILIDGNNVFGFDAETKRPITSGVFARSTHEPTPGQIDIHARGNITILGNTLLSATHENFGAVAVKTGSNGSHGGVIDVRSQNGNITLSDRAIDNANRYNAEATVTIFAKKVIRMSVSDRIDAGASTNEKPVIMNSAGRDGTGGTNTIRSFAGPILLSEGAHILSLGGLNGSAGINNISSCSGFTLAGIVNPSDANTADDSDLCEPTLIDFYNETNPVHAEFKQFLQTYANGALLCIMHDDEEPPPENTKPIITLLGANPLTITEDIIFTDPGATAFDDEDGNITSAIIVGGDTVHPNVPGTYHITYNVTDSEGLAADQKTRVVIIEELPTPPACSDNIDNDADQKTDQNDPACHTDGDPEHEDSYDPNAESENSKPVLTLLGDETMHVTIHTSFTDPGATAFDDEDGNITSNIVTGGDTVDINIIGAYVITYNVSDSRGAGAEEITRIVRVIETKPQCSDELDNDGDTRVDEADPTCHTDGNPENEDSYTPNMNTENAAPLLVLVGANPLEIIVRNEYIEFGATAHDEEDGDIPQNQIVTNATDVNTSTLGTYEVTYNVSDSDGKPANEITRTVRVVPAPHIPLCSDNIDNDADQKTDQNDPACHTDGDPEHEDSYDPNAESENSKPVLTLLGDNPLIIPTGNGYLEGGATAFDDEDGVIPSEKIVIGGNIVNPNIIGTYVVTYNVTDSKGLAAYEITRAVHVIEKQATCSDNLDNDADEKIDEADAGCHTDGNPENPNSYDPADTNENAKPVLTLLGSQSITIIKDDSYTDAGATAFDEEDGDITNAIEIENNVNTNTSGTYSIVYKVKDSKGISADDVTRALIVTERPSTGCTSNCGGGGGGGGGGSKIFLTITNENISLDDTGAAVLTWETNLQATSMVVYDVVSHGTVISPALPDNYAFKTSTSEALVTRHRVLVHGLSAGRAYYFRPYSDRSDDSEMGIELTINPASDSFTNTTPPQVSEISITESPCVEYLKSYIKFGAVNNSDDVRRLELFLNTFEGFSLPVDGIYNPDDHRAVTVFQERHRNEILLPWGHTKGTGYVYYTTRKYINEIYCANMFPLTTAQLAEISEFKTLLEQVLQQGGSPDDAQVDSVIGSADKKEPTQEESNIAQIPQNPDSTQLMARLQDALKNNMRIIGIGLILLAVVLAGVTLARSRR
ncbi:MAG: hypothetical protein A3J54_02605 [Candidatus Ryanbacteria bacterium RIFCSPHIGHO2_02_FULL_45_13b]|uniref:Pesticidal crystal protein Cry22Aa Ig-like domain-containing protein n=1 Tax=Candidatus Ryanbacteria bacterium RIFCSPHIGHO2_02_FULL_45_13b TaxID=1802117 RepID=A0A1G2G8H6_9BACT|nr:MAG: hypothetical protein A3J54_02605 [Candidatus Ryanbacteria bacterium RIFCSPHIGHO2_02_FULL_45_13b]